MLLLRHYAFLIDFREEGVGRGEEEEEEEEGRDWFVVPVIYAFIGSFLYVPDQGLNPQPSSIGTML